MLCGVCPSGYLHWSLDHVGPGHPLLIAFSPLGIACARMRVVPDVQVGFLRLLPYCLRDFFATTTSSWLAWLLDSRIVSRQSFWDCRCLCLTILGLKTRKTIALLSFVPWTYNHNVFSLLHCASAAEGERAPRPLLIWYIIGLKCKSRGSSDINSCATPQILAAVRPVLLMNFPF